MSNPFREDDEREIAEDVKEAAGFDYDEIYLRFGEEPSEQVKMNQLATVLHMMLDYLIEPMTGRGEVNAQLERVGRRVMAMLWVIEAAGVQDVTGDGLKEGKNLSLTKFAARFGLHKACMSELTAEFSKRFKIRNRSQEHGWNFKEGEDGK